MTTQTMTSDSFIDPQVGHALAAIGEPSKALCVSLLTTIQIWLDDDDTEETLYKTLAAEYQCCLTFTNPGATIEKFAEELAKIRSLEADHRVTVVWPVLPLLSEGAFGPWIPLPAFAHDDLPPEVLTKLKSQRPPNYDKFTFTQPKWHTHYEDHSNFSSRSNLWRSMQQLTQYPGETRIEAVAFLGHPDSLLKTHVFEGVVIRIRKITRLHGTGELFDTCCDLTLEEWILEGILCDKFGCHSMASTWWGQLDQQIFCREVSTCTEVMSRLRHQMEDLAEVHWGPCSQAQSYISSDTVETLALSKLKAEDECIICQMELAEPSTEGANGRPIRISCSGHHTFHASCLLQWLDSDNDTCPLCRSVVFQPLHLRNRGGLTQQESREVIGVPFRANEQWTWKHVEFAIERYFGIPSNRHGAFAGVSPNLPCAIHEIFARLARLAPYVRQPDACLWDQVYGPLYKDFVIRLRAFSKPNQPQITTDDFAAICRQVDVLKYSDSSKQYHEKQSKDLVSESYRLGALTRLPRASVAPNACLAARRVHFYRHVHLDYEFRTAAQACARIRDNDQTYLFRRSNVRHIEEFVRDCGRRGTTIPSPHDMDRLHSSYQEFTQVRSDLDRDNRQTAWDSWLEVHCGLTAANYKPRGYFAPMAGLAVNPASVNPLSSKLGTFHGQTECYQRPHELVAIAYARTHSVYGQTRSRRQFRSLRPDGLAQAVVEQRNTDLEMTDADTLYDAVEDDDDKESDAEYSPDDNDDSDSDDEESDDEVDLQISFEEYDALVDHTRLHRVPGVWSTSYLENPHYSSSPPHPVSAGTPAVEIE